MTNSLVVNSYVTIIDHIWDWGADHGSGVGWTSNTADLGVVIKGNNGALIHVINTTGPQAPTNSTPAT